MAPYLSRAVIFDGPTDANQRRASAPTTSVKRANHTNTHPSSSTCCSGGHHGCGCGCRNCSCQIIPVRDESNREAYSGQGGPGIPRSAYGFPGRASRLASSIDTEGPGQLNNNSYEVHDDWNERFPPGTRARNHPVDTHREQTQPNYDAASFSEDDHPWHHFTSRDHMSPRDELSDIFPDDIADDISMSPEHGGLDSRNLSIYEALFPPSSVSASQNLIGTGTGFAGVGGGVAVDQFLSLTPEHRHG